MMSLGPLHERQKSPWNCSSRLSPGSSRSAANPWVRRLGGRRGLDRAIESDLCYYFDRAKMAPAAAAADSNNIDDYPNPDLAVEVDVSPPKIDRSGIYAAHSVCRNSGGRGSGPCRSSSSILTGNVCSANAESLPTRPNRRRHPTGLQRGLERSRELGGAGATGVGAERLVPRLNSQGQ